MDTSHCQGLGCQSKIENDIQEFVNKRLASGLCPSMPPSPPHPTPPHPFLQDLCVGNNIRLEGVGCEIKGHITMMISIDLQPWAHRGGPAFVTSKLNPIADPRHTLMNWPCSPSLFN